MAAHVTPKQRKEILRLQAGGHTNLAIAEQLGIDRHTVGRHAEPKPRNVGGEPPLSADELARLRFVLAGLTMSGECPECKKTFYWSPTQKRVRCNWCGTDLEVTTTLTGPKS